MFGKGEEVTAAAKGYSRYIGVAPMKIKGVNPSKEGLGKFLGSDMDEPVYISYVDRQDPTGAMRKCKQIRVDFLAELDNSSKGFLDGAGKPIEWRTRMTFYLLQRERVSKSGKKQVIDVYGRTAWATPEEIAAKAIPVYSGGRQAGIDADYRLAYDGEEELTQFLIAYLNIPPVELYSNGQWVMRPENERGASEARLDKMTNLFNGDMKELKDIVAYQPNNVVKALFGVRAASDGKLYQTFYKKAFLRGWSSNYAFLEKEVRRAKEAGGEPNTEYLFDSLREYSVKPTDFSRPAQAAGSFEAQTKAAEQDDLPF